MYLQCDRLAATAHLYQQRLGECDSLLAAATGEITARYIQETPKDETTIALSTTVPSKPVVRIDNTPYVILTTMASTLKDDSPLWLIPAVCTPTNQDRRERGARPKTSAVIQPHMVTTIISSTNTKPTAIP